MAICNACSKKFDRTDDDRIFVRSVLNVLHIIIRIVVVYVVDIVVTSTAK